MACARGCCATQAEHYKSLVFGVGEGIERARGHYRQFDGDMDAYKRLRRSGAVPPQVSGSAYLEKHANTDAQVEGRPEGTPSSTATLAQLQDWEP